MSQRAPQTLSVKRKRTEAPVDSLIFDNSVKRQRSEADIFFRRLTKPGDKPLDSGASTPTTERRFHLDPVSRAKSKHVFIERRAATEPSTPYNERAVPAPQPPAQEPTRPRKRPGTRAASAALPPTTATTHSTHRSQPSEHDVRELEALSHRLEHEEIHAPHTSPSKYKPKPPARRFAEREPEKAAYLAARDGDHNTDTDAMDLDTDDYVIDTYVRETLLPDSSGNLPTATGSVGYLVLAEEDEDWWASANSDSEREFDTDDDDSNAEEYYANDYPEDELSEDDEFGRDPYKRGHRRGSDDEEFDAGESDDALGSGEDEDDLHYKMTVPKAKRTGYWGMNGQ
ncbi:hypothetical protein SVAN01_11300 [Stagonosporopsis vannaccii]|nr:hypothetical protein SVAN01_11300 [Stagonosporopsis vannaccii]